MSFNEYKSALSNASTATFREWIGKHIAGWKAAGFVQTNDVGQVNVATIELPGVGGNNAAGYAMFRFNDDLQATAPVFIRFDFGSYTGTTNAYTSPALSIAIGKSTDGAGTLQGILLPKTQLGYYGSTSNNVTTEKTHYAASGPGWIGLIASVDDTESGAYLRNLSFIVERSRGMDGSPTAEGLMVCFDFATSNRTLSNAGAADQMVSVYGINYSSGAYMLGVPPVLLPYEVSGTVMGPSSSLAAGSIGPVFPWVIMAPGLVPWQSCVIVCIPSGDFPGAPFRSRLCGQEATFRPVAASIVHSRWGMAVAPRQSSTKISQYVGPAIRWEA